MKKTIRILIILIFSVNVIFAQSWGDSGSCQRNVNDPYYMNDLVGRQGIISATVKLNVEGGCTGTLINRNISDENVGFYVLTARHCIEGIDFDATHTVYFNYQSPGADNESTAPSNRGEGRHQSTNLDDDGFEYRHRTQLRLVADYLWGDLALIEILTPVPPHFNVTYSGWNPSKFYSVIVGTPPQTYPSPIVGVHHPEGDIKKISGINHIQWLETPIATGCYTITTIIDVLFGWIWGNTTSTSVICNYVDNPWLIVPYYQYGVVEHGSSGSGIFGLNNRHFGVLSGLFGTCAVPITENYGKLHSNYSHASIKNALNPSNNVWVDLFGMGERKITQYENLILPGAVGVSGEYFPANHYQDENKIILRATNNIETTQPITIHAGANYEFIAGNSIILGDGFHVEEGANFHASIEPQKNIDKDLTTTLEQDIIQKLYLIELPLHKEFEIEKYLTEDNEDIQISDAFPNPNTGNFYFEISTNNKKTTNFKIELTNMQGTLVYVDNVTVNSYKLININKQDLHHGLYILTITNDKVNITKKIIKN